MEFRPNLVFECLSRLIIKQRHERTGYFAYVIKEGLISFGRSSATNDERTKHLIVGVKDLVLKHVGYTLQDTIKNNRTLSLDKFYDLLHTIGRVFLLDVKVTNNGKEMKALKLDQSELTLRPMLLFVFGLKDKKALLSYQFKPIQETNKSLQSTTVTETNTTVLPKKSEVHLSDSDSSLSSGSSYSSDEDCPFWKGDANKTTPPGESCCDSNIKQPSSESKYKREYSDDDEVKERQSISPIKIVKEANGDEGYTVIRKKISQVNDQILEQRKNLLEIVEKHSEWTQKLDKHVLGHVTACNLCPIHCYGLLAKKISRQSGRKIGNSSKSKSASKSKQ